MQHLSFLTSHGRISYVFEAGCAAARDHDDATGPDKTDSPQLAEPTPAAPVVAAAAAAAPAKLPTLLFLAGFGDEDNYLHLKSLAARLDPRFPRLFVNRLGVADSDQTTAPRTLANQCVELHELVAGLAAAPLVFVTHSWGGLLARAYAAYYPTEVRGLIGIEPTTLAVDAIFETEPYQQAIAWLSELSEPERDRLGRDPEWTADEQAEVSRTASVFEEGSTLWRDYQAQAENFREFAALVGGANLLGSTGSSSRVEPSGPADSSDSSSRPTNLTSSADESADADANLVQRQDSSPAQSAAESSPLPALLFYQPFRDAEYRASEYAGPQTVYVPLTGHHFLHFAHPQTVADRSNAFLRSLLASRSAE